MLARSTTSSGPLAPDGVITPAACPEIDPEPGDAVLFHTGWGRRGKDPEGHG
jgi:kynurenine formamidase